jgi:hypothetical protein
LTSPEELFIQDGSKQNRSKPIFKKPGSWKLTRKGWAFLGIAVLTAFLAWFQYHDNEIEQHKLRSELATRDSISREELRIRDKQTRAEQLHRDSISNENLRKRDSLASVRIEKGKNETIVALGKYSLRYDSAQKIIERLVKDSAKKTIIQPADPIFRLCNSNGITVKKYDLDSLIITVRKCNEVAESKKINVRIYLVIDIDSDEYSPKLMFLARWRLIEDNAEMAPDDMRSGDIGFGIRNASQRGYRLYAWVKGTFMNSDLSKSFEIDKVYSVSLKSNFFGICLFPEFVKDFIIKNKLE